MFLKLLGLVLVLFVVSCKKGDQGLRQRNDEGLLLRDNLEFIYDNYKYAKIDEKIKGFQDRDGCIQSCVEEIVKVVVMPMNFGNRDVMEEVYNTVHLVGQSGKKRIAVFDGVNLENYFSYETPNVVIGAFVEEDLEILKSKIDEVNVEVPVLALTSDNEKAKGGVYSFGYSIKSEASSMMEILSGQGYVNFAFFGKGDDIGSSLYSVYNAVAKKNKQEVLYVDFYSDDVILKKSLKRLKQAVVQNYYENVETGEVAVDDHHFEKQIVKRFNAEGKEVDGGHLKDVVMVVTAKEEKFYKKVKLLDAVIIDADVQGLQVIVDYFEKDEMLKNVMLIASSRTVDAILLQESNVQGVSVINSGLPVFFASNFGIYSEYVERYLEVYGRRPSRLSVTLYEVLKYAFEVTNGGDSFDVRSVPVFVGPNGTMVVKKNGEVERFVNVAKFQNGTVREIVDSYKFLKR